MKTLTCIVMLVQSTLCARIFLVFHKGKSVPLTDLRAGLERDTLKDTASNRCMQMRQHLLQQRRPDTAPTESRQHRDCEFGHICAYETVAFWAVVANRTHRSDGFVR